MSVIGKSVAALVVAVALVFIVNAMGDIYHPTRTLEEPVYRLGLDGAAGDAGQVAEAAPEPEQDLFTLINAATAEEGEAVFRQCSACHTAEIGGPNRVGPNLGNVVGAPIPAKDDFNYSDALAGHGGEWDYEALNAWLENPAAFAPGNKMTFAGIKDIADRAAVIKYLMAHTENPPPVPEPAPAEAEAAAAEPAEGEDAAAPAGGEAAAEAPAAAGEGFTALVAAADPAAGQTVFNQCRACHTYEIGGPHRVGPNLGNVVGSDIASQPEYNYSDALAAMEGSWTYEALNAWLENPSAFAPGNKMTFAGVKSEEDRAALVAFLMQHTENPPPLGDAGDVAAPGVPSETLQEAVPEPQDAGERPSPPVAEGGSEAEPEPAPTQ